MAGKLKVAIIGDTHFCRKEMRGVPSERVPLHECPDYIRYSDMADSILKPMLLEIRKLKPDVLISTGDFVEGGMSGKENTYAEMEEAWAIMNSADCPFLMAKGTHENHEAYNDIVLAGLSTRLGRKLENAYFSYRNGDCMFFFLDYLNYKRGGEQDRWLEENLKNAAAENMRIFIIAHPPVYNWGRHFFNEPEFILRMIELFDKYPVDGYFCGHTHNQSVSFHATGAEGKGYLQVMASSVGFPEMDLVALKEFHSVAEFTEKDHFFWGILEDSSPGFYMLEIGDAGINLKWITYRGDAAASLLIEGRRSFPDAVRLPDYRKTITGISEGDLYQIKSACLHMYGIYRNVGSTALLFNGVPLGAFPTNPVYAARRFIPLDGNALKTISINNMLEMILPDEDNFVVGSISLEIVLYDNRIIHSEVSPELFVCGDFWKKFPLPRKVFDCKKGKNVSIFINVRV